MRGTGLDALRRCFEVTRNSILVKHQDNEEHYDIVSDALDEVRSAFGF